MRSESVTGGFGSVRTGCAGPEYGRDGARPSAALMVMVLVLGSVVFGQEVKFAPHPRLMLSGADLVEVKGRIERHDWAKQAFDRLKRDADGWLGKEIDLPDRGGQWSHWYACPKHGARLVTESPTRHVCPVDGEVFSGYPYDDVVISHRHNDFAAAARDLGLVYRITGDAKYAAKAKEILLGYGEKYLTYPLHSNHGEKDKVGGGRALSQSLSEATWLIKLVQAADLVWETLTPQEIEKLKTKLFYPAAVEVIQKHQMPIHNIVRFSHFTRRRRA